MRFVALIALVASLAYAAPGATQGHGRGHGQRDQDAAYRALQQGDILPLDVILSRIRIRNGRFIGADLDPSGTIYRLTFMGSRGEVVRFHVNARTGQALGVSR
jgi:hypothetical protein